MSAGKRAVDRGRKLEDLGARIMWAVVGIAFALVCLAILYAIAAAYFG